MVGVDHLGPLPQPDWDNLAEEIEALADPAFMTVPRQRLTMLGSPAGLFKIVR
jgi:hypothetical protein